MNFLYKICILFCLISSQVFASHIKGGEIRASHISGQTYKISVQLYFDAVAGAGPAEAQSAVEVCMGDKNVITVQRTSLNELPGNAGVSVGLYETNYTYPSSGRYQISASINNRTNIVNYPNGNQSNVFLWTILNTEVANSTPVLPNLNFSAGIKQVFSLDIKATNTDADSVSVRLQKLSKPSPGTCGVRSIDQSYVYPNDITKTGTFRVNQTEKKLVWTAPEQAGSYLYAMVVDEWRGGINISETYREGMIDVTDKPGPSVEIPPYDYAENPGGPVTSTPSLDSREISIAVEAYPVPTDNFINVKAYSKKQSVIKMQVIDMHGRVLDEIKSAIPMAVMQEQFDLSDYPKGIYIIRAENDQESVSQKVLR